MRSKAFGLLVTFIITISCNEKFIHIYQPINVNVNIKSPTEMKSVITGNTLPEGSTIGLFVTSENDLIYNNKYISNIKYSTTEEGKLEACNINEEIMLSTSMATLSGYYPYSQSVTDISAIPVQATSDVQNDWMWATPIAGLNNKNYTATMTMNHALTVVRLKISKGTYSGEGQINFVSFSSNAAATSAVLDATDGKLKFIDNYNFQYKTDKSFTLNENQLISFITIPSGIEDSIHISALVDGRLLTGTTEKIILEPGKIYEYKVSIGIKELFIKDIEILQWNNQTIDIII